jgi:uncharacterized protein YbaP (TraB family)
MVAERAMKRFLLRFVLLACLAPALAAPAAAATFLWEVVGVTNRVYLYGTIHAGKAGWFPLRGEVEEALADSKVLVVEADVTNTKALEKYAGSMTYNAPDSLKNHVPADDFERFRKILPRYRFPESQVAQMKPFMAVSLLVFAEWARQGYNPQYSIDAYLIAKAKAEAKPIVEIEGIDMQMRLMESLTEQQSRELFASTLVALETGLSADLIKGLVQAWEAGDPDQLLGIARSYNAEVKGAAEFEEKFIWSRHDDMLPKIEGYLNDSKDRHFIAVGSLHLAGPRGLVEQLRRRGYIVRQK